MTQSITEIAEIRDVISKLLNELGLDAYLFEVEPREGLWDLVVECATNDGWKTVNLKANKEIFQHGTDDSVYHDLLIDEWREALSECNVKFNK